MHLGNARTALLAWLDVGRAAGACCCGSRTSTATAAAPASRTGSGTISSGWASAGTPRRPPNRRGMRHMTRRSRDCGRRRGSSSASARDASCARPRRRTAPSDETPRCAAGCRDLDEAGRHALRAEGRRRVAGIETPVPTRAGRPARRRGRRGRRFRGRRPPQRRALRVPPGGGGGRRSGRRDRRVPGRRPAAGHGPGGAAGAARPAATGLRARAAGTRAGRSTPEQAPWRGGDRRSARRRDPAGGDLRCARPVGRVAASGAVMPAQLVESFALEQIERRPATLPGLVPGG